MRIGVWMVVLGLWGGLAWGQEGSPERVRDRLAGPTTDASFRAADRFAPLDWPAPSERRLASGAPGPAYWENRTDYRIDATLDAEARSVSATATITYHNHSPHELGYLWLHLEQNLFREDSVGALSKEPGSRFGYREGFEGGYDIAFVRAGGESLPLQVYDTLGRIDLAEPLAPGETFEFEIGWSFNIPPFGADRMGLEDVEQGTIFQLAQWFPAVAAYDDVHGWNALGYLGQGEFYTDFGDYDVRITAPRSHVVVSTGMLHNQAEVLTETAQRRYATALASDEAVAIRGPEEVGDASAWPAGEGPLTWRFTARDVRTFAWASSDAFIWEGAGLTVRGSALAPDGRVFVQAVYPKEALPLWADAVEMGRHSVDFHSRMWHPYPYPVAINVNGVVGGMEYPGIVFCRNRTSERGLYGVTDHEFGHAWFPMMVNTDERRHAWMDEGFNSFMNIYSRADYFGQTPPGDGRGSPRRVIERQSLPNQQPILTRPDGVWRGRLGYLAYGKPAAALWQLRENVLGHERFDRAFREYIRRWAFKRPQPEDFFRTIEDVAGADLAWFWRGWFSSTATLDQAVVGVEHEADGSWVYVDLENRGGKVMPVDLEVEYADGSTERRRLPVEIWTTTDAWTAGWNPGGREVVRVELDPDGMLPDMERENNVWERE